MKMDLPKLYKRTTTGNIQQWEVITEGNTFYVREGILNGKLTSNKPTICKGKNTGKTNQTSDVEQANLEAKAKWNKKKNENYFEDINKIDELTLFEPMLANKFLDQKNIDYPVGIEVKYDGIRGVCLHKGLFSRKGKPIPACVHIREILNPVFKEHPNWIIDGELYNHEANFETVCSLIKQTKPTVEDLNQSKKLIKYYIYDCMLDNKELCFNERYNLLQKEINKLVKSNSIVFTTVYIANNRDDVFSFHDRFVSLGYEGAIIRKLVSKYENKRTNSLLKLKNFTDEEFEILDIVEGKGNRAGMAGSITVDVKVNNVTSDAGIKGGEEYYKYLLDNRKNLIGKLATVRYQGFTAEGKLRFPVVMQIDRID